MTDLSKQEKEEIIETAKAYFEDEDNDIVIPPNPFVEKVEDGYWVEARVWVSNDGDET